MLNKPIDNRKDKCTNISSECVIWDGPDIPCLDLCYGDSIEKVVYEQTIALCNLIEQLKPQGLDFSCLLTDNSCKPKDINELLQFILNKICEVIDTIPKPFTCEDAFKCKVSFTMCPTRDCDGQDTAASTIELPLYTTDGTDNFIKFIVEKVCDLYCKISGLEEDVSSIHTEITTIWEAITNIQNVLNNQNIIPTNLPNCIGSQYISNWEELYNWLSALALEVKDLMNTIYGGCSTRPLSIDVDCNIGNNTFSFTANNLIDFIIKFEEYISWLCQRLNEFNTSITDINTEITNINTQLAECGCGCPKDIFEIIPKFNLDNQTDKYVINQYVLVSAIPVTGLSFNYDINQGHGAYYINLNGNPQSLTIGTDIVISGKTITVNKCPDPSQYSSCNEYNMSTELVLYIGVQYTIGTNNGDKTCNINLLKRFQVKHCVCGYVENVQIDEKINLYSNEYLNN